MTKNLGFIGFGKMASAICKGVINSGFIKPCNIYAYDVNFEHLKEAAEELKINAVVDVKTLAKNVSNILVATKPFVVDDVLSNLKDVADDKLIISILAGITIQKYEDNLPNSRIIRVMPNTPAMVNEGMSVVCRGNKSTDDDLQFVLDLFSKLGSAISLDETQINAVTAVSGSGPAFYYYIIDKIARAGEVLGLNYDVALKLSAQTALGAAKMIIETNKTPEDLITAVTTPNGTTAEGNKVLIESDIEKVLFETVEKTCIRAVELGKGK